MGDKKLLDELSSARDSNHKPKQDTKVDLDINSVEGELGDAEACKLELLRIEVRQREEELKQAKDDREQRREFATRIFGLLSVYLAVVGLLVLLASIDRLGVSISDSVLITILGTTTANIIALFRFVARYLYK